jgi:quercetin dioxygenase-like cupin family protein
MQVRWLDGTEIKLMLKPGYYLGRSEHEIAVDLGREGLAPKRIVEQPGSRYDRHKNAFDILMAFVSGSANIRIGERNYVCRAGDRLIISGGIEHSAVVGDNGCVYFMTQCPTCAD